MSQKILQKILDLFENLRITQVQFSELTYEIKLVILMK